jgi:hypothetical protein
MVHVTHEQSEALTLSDHIAVFARGRIRRISTAEEVHERPASSGRRTGWMRPCWMPGGCAWPMARRWAARRMGWRRGRRPVASVRLERVLPMAGWRAGCWRWPIPAEAVRVFPANPP